MQLADWRKFPGVARDFVALLWQEFKEDGCRETAAALTYTTLFAIVPLMTVTFTVLSALPQAQGQGQQIQDWLFSYVMPSADVQIQQYLQGFAEQAAHLTSIGIIFLVVTSVLMLRTIEATMNRIWKVKTPRKGLTSLLMYWAVLTLGPICLGVGLAASSYVASMSLVRDTVQFFGIAHLLLVLIPFLFSCFLLTLLYIVVPNCHVPIKKGLVGGVCAAVLFELAKAGFVLFIKNAPSYQLVYGAFAAVPLFLLWIFISWVIMLAGAELVRALVVFRETRQRVPQLQALLRLLEALWLRQRSGDLLKPAHIRRMLVAAGVERWDEFRNLLMDLGLMSRTDGGTYVLTRDLSQLTLTDLVRMLPWSLDSQLHVDTPLNKPWETALQERIDKANGGVDSALDVPLASLFQEDNLPVVGKEEAV